MLGFLCWQHVGGAASSPAMGRLKQGLVLQWRWDQGQLTHGLGLSTLQHKALCVCLGGEGQTTGSPNLV